MKVYNELFLPEEILEICGSELVKNGVMSNAKCGKGSSNVDLFFFFLLIKKSIKRIAD